MEMNEEDNSVRRKELAKQRLPYHAPRLATLGALQLLVQHFPTAGTDGADPVDCGGSPLG